MKKILSLFLLVVMILTCMPCFTVSANDMQAYDMAVSGTDASLDLAKYFDMADSGSKNISVMTAFYDANNILIGFSSESVTVSAGNIPVINKECPEGTVKAKAILHTQSGTESGGAPEAKEIPKHVMIIGNSFSVDSTRYVHEIAKAMGYDINVHLIQVDGTLSKEAYDVLKDDVENGGGAYWGYNYNAGEPEISRPSDFMSRTRYTWHKHSGDAKPTAYSGWLWKISDVTSQYDIDLIVMQNYWANGFGLQAYSSDTDPSRSFEDTYSSYYVDIAKLLLELEPEAELMINSVWANEMGYNIYPAFGSKASQHGFTSDAFGKQSYFYDTMEKFNGQAAIDVGKAVNAGGEPIGQFPVGYAVQLARNWQNEDGDYHFRTTSRSFLYEDDGKELQMVEEDALAGRTRLNRDGFHMSVAARYLAGLVWVEVLTSEDVRDCTYIPPAEILSCGGAAKPEGGTATISVHFPVISAEDAKTLREIAHKAVTNFKTRGLNDPSLPLTFEQNTPFLTPLF